MTQVIRKGRARNVIPNQVLVVIFGHERNHFTSNVTIHVSVLELRHARIQSQMLRPEDSCLCLCTNFIRASSNVGKAASCECSEMHGMS